MYITLKLRFLLLSALSFLASSVNSSTFNDNLFGLSTVLGPDTYGILDQYKRSYLEGFSQLSAPEVSVAQYLKFASKLEGINSKVFSKYKQVTGIFMSTSRFYYNYRHSGNVFAVISQFAKHGFLSNKYMTPILPETCACHPINTAAGRIYIESNVNLDYYRRKIAEDKSNIYFEDLIMKYTGHGLLKDHFRYNMTSRYPKRFPNSMKVFTQYPVEDEVDYNKFVYMTGHGGNSYLQFQAKDFISSLEMAQNFKEMHIKEPNMKIFTILDTCQASTMYNYLDESIPLAWVASSVKGESSYSHNPNPYISISTCDKFTFVFNTFLNTVLSGILEGTAKASISRLSLKQFVRNFERNSKKERIAFDVSKNIYDEEEKSKKLEKVYLGQFIFNYRKLYLNSIKFHVEKSPRASSAKFKTFKIKELESLKNAEKDSYLEKMKRFFEKLMNLST